MGNHAVLVQVLRPRVALLRQGVRVFCLQIVGAELSKVGTRHVQHRLPGMDVLSRHDQDPGDRSANLGDDGSGFKKVVGDCSGKPQYTAQACGCDCHHLHVPHLLLRHGKKACARWVAAGGTGGGRGRISFCRPSRARRGKKDRENGSGGRHRWGPSRALPSLKTIGLPFIETQSRHFALRIIRSSIHGKFLVPTASRTCSTASM